MNIYYKYNHSGAPKNLSKEDVRHEIRRACEKWEKATGNIIRFIKLWDEFKNNCNLSITWGSKLQFSGGDKAMLVVGEARTGIEEFAPSTIVLNGEWKFSNGRDTFWQIVMRKLSVYVSLEQILTHEIGHFLIRKPEWHSIHPGSVMYEGLLENGASILSEEALLAIRAINKVNKNN